VGNLETYDSFVEIIEHLEKVFEIKPEIVACDLHPDYLSTRFALGLKGIKKTSVQHHHAHIASVLAENRIDGKVIGAAFDGTGYGTDGSIWGGEFLIADRREFIRAAHLRGLPMPGAEAAVRDPWKMAVSYLYSSYGEDLKNLKIDFIRKADKKGLALVMDIIRRNINSPMTSSAGRLFEAVSAIVGVCQKNTYRGQAAMELEGIAADGLDDSYIFEIENKTGELIIDWAGIIRAVVKELSEGVPRELISARFHNTIAETIRETSLRLRKIYDISRIALSGGVFQNFYLLRKTREKLHEAGFTVYQNRLVPPNDGGISLGQAVIADARS